MKNKRREGRKWAYSSSQAIKDHQVDFTVAGLSTTVTSPRSIVIASTYSHLNELHKGYDKIGPHPSFRPHTFQLEVG